MPFLELSLRVRAEDEHRAENALMDLGALSVTLLDADAATPNEKAVLEPGVGETPLWPEITLLALFPEGTVAELVLHALESFDDAIDLSQADFREVADQDWERAWMDQYEPLKFGRRTWIVPWNMDAPPEAREGVIVRLDPGLAFGSGTHPTTALCLQWLDSLVLREKTVLDFGCGSGILALAALKLGAKQAVGVDNDPQALLATADNAERNGVGDRLRVYSPEDEPADTYPVVVANILAVALDALAPLLASRVQPGGVIALSGILHGQEGELLARYAGWFDQLEAVQEGDWMRITGVRRAG
ncbi:MAG: ribosomal protein L11 methyltransferase [Arenimonas sp. SCN 70-307]|uniref:50S ribosomal protein L11 methyltransferase n=1 Tax=Arenimonas sp. SCN 70-307 TaxID=1660089 RepID=UPI000869BDF6|nr:50S ribosomal protein L11 methyltransferase [Arenimonas sp. SCN 70-307]ODS63683.1 MAG: ribosomal protein L11 methyltransferase [Arenimonas sp. SCN 70-307]